MLSVTGVLPQAMNTITLSSTNPIYSNPHIYQLGPKSFQMPLILLNYAVFNVSAHVCIHVCMHMRVQSIHIHT